MGLCGWLALQGQLDCRYHITMNVEGLPEGVELIRIGSAEREGEYAVVDSYGTLVPDLTTQTKLKYKTLHHNFVPIVRIAPGYRAVYTPERGGWFAIKYYEIPVKKSVTFSVEHSWAEESLAKMLTYMPDGISIEPPVVTDGPSSS